MPALAVRQGGGGDGATELSWSALPTARAYFVAGMGAGSAEEMVIWTWSELPDSGFGLIDDQSNPPGESPAAPGEEKPEPKQEGKKPGALDLLEGMLGR